MKQYNIVGYYRVSTIEQKKGYGIDIQVRDIERYAQDQGWRVSVFYKDEAQSGVEERRRALQRLLRACKTGAVEAVIISSLDRLSRSLRFAENLFFEFEQLGVTVCIADMPHYDGKDRKEVLMRQIKEVIAEENRKDIIERLKKGREERARSGKVSGGNLAYGYIRRDGHVEVNAEEAEVVRRIFTLHDEGRRYRQIAEDINDRGYRQRNDKLWTPRQVRKIQQRRELYSKGIVKYGSSEGRNPGMILLG